MEGLPVVGDNDAVVWDMLMIGRLELVEWIDDIDRRKIEVMVQVDYDCCSL